MVPALFLATGCHKALPPGNPEFNDAVRYAFVNFASDEVVLAYAIRTLDTNIEASMDVEAESPNDRAMEFERLTEDDVADLEHPDRDPAAALPVALAGVSPYPPSDHSRIQILPDQRPVEPYSPDKYDRTFLAGEDCFVPKQCQEMDTFNDLIKKNFLMEVPYQFNKDFRWVDLDLPDPADVPEGTVPEHGADPNWAMVAKSWQLESADGTGGNTHIYQSFTIEVWIPRDAGTLHMLALWTESDPGISASDETIAATTRGGIQRNFDAADEWIAANPE